MMNEVFRQHKQGAEQGAEQEVDVELEQGPFKHTIFAVDLDGVIADPIGYREALIETIAFFGKSLGVDTEEFMLSDRNKSYGRSMTSFEAEKIPDPWDVSAIIVSLMKLRKVGINVTNAEALDAIVDNRNTQTNHPPDVIRQWIIDKYGDQLEVGVMEDISNTLDNSRDVLGNEITSVFQEYVLGTDTFGKTYGIEGRTGAEESLISTKDRLLIDSDGRRVMEYIAKNGGRVVIYTGRPGLPPPDIKRDDGDGFAPEAELAVKNSGLDPIGIVSMGSMEWLGKTTTRSTKELTKPNVTHALSTIISGLRGRIDSEVLLDAFKWADNGEIPEEITQYIEGENELKLVVLEDATSGVDAFIDARRILEAIGVKVHLTVIGVHGQSAEKFDAFHKLEEKEEVDSLIQVVNVGEGITSYSRSVLQEAGKDRE